MTSTGAPGIQGDTIRLPASSRTLALAAAVVGAAGIGLAVLMGGWEHFLRSYLTSFAFLLSLALGALFFVILQHLTRSGWSVTVRRVSEVLASSTLPLAILFIPVILGIGALYVWGHEGEHGSIGAGHLGAKSGWLSPPFFVVRVAVYFGIWILLSRFYLRNSLRQDESGDPALTTKMQRLSPVAMILYGITVTLSAFDILMSLEPHWYSTIFGVYFFAGGIMGFFALLIVTVFSLQKMGRIVRSVTTEHYHDLGKQMYGYMIFWAYIAFSQLLLIWYANIPEETVWFLTRWTGGWQTVSYVLILGHFLFPFLILLPREMKRRPLILTAIAVWLLGMHWVDIYWLVVPENGDGGVVPFGIADVLCLVGIAGLLKAAVIYRLSSVPLVPEKDPRLAEALTFENI